MQHTQSDKERLLRLIVCDDQLVDYKSDNFYYYKIIKF